MPLWIIAVLTLLLAAPVYAQKAPAAKPWERLNRCTLIENRWNDGDSFHVGTPDGQERIFRLYFVDCPETDDTYPDRVADQAEYFGTDVTGVIRIGKAAADSVLHLLRRKAFTVWTRWRVAPGRSKLPRFYALVIVDGRDLNEILVENGLARIYGTRIPLPDGRDSRKYLAHLRKIEAAARAADRGGWASPRRMTIGAD